MRLHYLILAFVLIVLMPFIGNAHETANRQNKEDTIIISTFDKCKEAERLLNLYWEALKDPSKDSTFVYLFQSIDIFPTPEAHYEKGMFMSILSPESAIESFQFCIDHKYKLEESYFYLGFSYNRLGNSAAAKEAFSNALNLNPNNLEVLEYRGWANYNVKDYLASIADCNRALSLESTIPYNYSDFHILYAANLINLKEYDKASKHLTVAFEKDHGISTNDRYWMYNAMLCYCTEKPLEALFSVNNHITIDNSDAGSYFFRGLVHLQLGNISDGCKDFQRAKELGVEEASSALNQIDANDIDFNKTTVYSMKIESPSYRKKGDSQIKILSIELTNEATIIHFEYTNTEYPIGGWYNIARDTHIIDKSTGKKHFILTSDNCAFGPDTTSINLNETKRFSLYFPQISRDCKEIDFIENIDSEWKYDGIVLK